MTIEIRQHARLAQLLQPLGVRANQKRQREQRLGLDDWRRTAFVQRGEHGQQDVSVHDRGNESRFLIHERATQDVERRLLHLAFAMAKHVNQPLAHALALGAVDLTDERLEYLRLESNDPRERACGGAAELIVYLTIGGDGE